MFHEVVRIVPNENYTVTLSFDDGKTVLYDVSPFLEKGIFQSLIDKNIFVNTCTIINNTLAWDLEGNRDANKCLDIDPETLYELQSIEKIQ